MHKAVGRFGVLAGVMVLTLLGAAGCASGTDAAGGTPGAPATATLTPTTVATPTSGASSAAPLPIPTPIPTPTSSGNTWALSASGVGPLTLGRTWGQLAADPTIALDGDLAGCSTVFLMVPGYQIAVGFSGSQGDVARDRAVRFVDVQASEGAIGTPVLGESGVTLGSTAAAVEKAYPGGTWAVPAFNPEMDRIYVVDGGAAPITFGFAGDVVTGVVVGERDLAYEFCG